MTKAFAAPVGQSASTEVAACAQQYSSCVQTGQLQSVCCMQVLLCAPPSGIVSICILDGYAVVFSAALTSAASCQSIYVYLL